MLERGMDTTFSKWLRAQGEAHYAYAKRRGLGQQSIRTLVGLGRVPRELTRLSLLALTRASEDSGIPIQTLIDEARAAARDPVEPRKYVKRGVEDGKAQAAE